MDKDCIYVEDMLHCNNEKCAAYKNCYRAYLFEYAMSKNTTLGCNILVPETDDNIEICGMFVSKKFYKKSEGNS